MLFPTVEFAVFFVLVFAATALVRPAGEDDAPVVRLRSAAWRLGMVAASLYFYAQAPEGWTFVWLLVGSIAGNWCAGELVASCLRPGRQPTAASRWAVRLGVAGNLAVLGWFKYYMFFAEDVVPALNQVPGLGWMELAMANVFLPVGISFFTFQAISYVVDIGRGIASPLRPLDFALYLSFFPQLVAGPIVRATEFAPQLRRRAGARSIDAVEAFHLIGRGLVKKAVVSSYVANAIVDPAFAVPSQYSGAELLWAVYAYAVQIYLDFSGYTEIAIGCALLIGFRFPRNFDSPYRALSIQEFWRRWHMTLSRWLRDYLYVPLGGSRRGLGRTYVNLLATMVLGGLWHGANWRFVIWGAIHGGVLALERWLGSVWPWPGTGGRIVAVARWARHLPRGLPGVDLLPGGGHRDGLRGHPADRDRRPRRRRRRASVAAARRSGRDAGEPVPAGATDAGRAGPVPPAGPRRAGARHRPADAVPRLVRLRLRVHLLPVLRPDMTSLNLGPSPRPPEGGLRPVLRLTAGQVLFVMALGLLLGALLNADLLMKAAERRAFDDPHRDLHVAVWRVAQNVSHALFLDEPRNLIDGLTANRPPPPPVDGPRGTAGAAPGDVEGGFGPVPPPGPAPDAPPPPGPGAAGVVAGPDAPPPPGPGAAEIVAGPDVRVPTTDDPLRVWIGGDSMIGSAGLAFRRIAAASGVMASDEVDVRVSTGLARPDFFDWPAHLEEQVLAKDPEIVILMFGANDAQSLRRPDGSYCRRFEQCWLDTYRGRVADTMDLLREPGGKRLVVWVGQPIMSSSSGVHGIDKMNHLFWDEARKRHWVAYVDAWAWFVDAAGAYARHLPAEDGTESRMRAQDGVHLTMAGGRRLAWVVMGRIRDLVDLSHGTFRPRAGSVAPAWITPRVEVPAAVAERLD